MPGVKKLFQESENSGKASFIFGHFLGGIGVLVGNSIKQFCLPISMTIQDGLQEIKAWPESAETNESSQESHVEQMIRQASEIAKQLGHSILLLDRYFLTVPALKMWKEKTQEAGKTLLTLVTKAKRNAIAYEKPPMQKGRGRPKKKGTSVKLQTLFSSEKEAFTKATVFFYGAQKQVEYRVRDLLWGKKWYQELRFVLVKYDGIESILVCTDTGFSAEQIIRLYGYRFKIESFFRELKQVLAGLSYHFWSKSMPKLNRFHTTAQRKKEIEQITNPQDRKRILLAYRATEAFVMISCIAMGLLQIIALRFSCEVEGRWLRTKSNEIPSEGTTAAFLRQSFFRCFLSKPDFVITRFIRSVQRKDPDSSGSQSA